jgi:hypothetical protein
MPFLNIYTNVSRDKTTKELNIELSKLMASTLGKPEGYCSVRLVSGKILRSNYFKKENIRLNQPI